MNSAICLGKDNVGAPHSDAPIFSKPQYQKDESVLSGKEDDEQKPLHCIRLKFQVELLIGILVKHSTK